MYSINTPEIQFELLHMIVLCFFVCTDIRSSGCTAGNVRRGVNIHLYTASENVAECHVGYVSFHRWSLASH